MKYMGSKARIAKHILPIILKDRKEGQWYVDPFVGGANMIDKVEGNRIGADLNRHLISALELIKQYPELLPKNNSEYTQEMYLAAKDKDDLSHLECFAMFAYSFSGKFKGGYAKGHPREDFQRAARNSAIKQSPLIQGVEFINSTYKDLDIPAQSIIYCDPPYSGTTKYKGTDKFNHSDFWQWCREMCLQGHRVFVSEYAAPDDFVCVWRKEVNSNPNAKATSRAIEKLFVHESQA
jgi:DNA adenine methylase